jgi:hypothetical protein
MPAIPQDDCWNLNRTVPAAHSPVIPGRREAASQESITTIVRAELRWSQPFQTT